MERTCFLAAAILMALPPVALAQPSVLAHLPRERREEMSSALRLEFAGRGTVVLDETEGELNEAALPAGTTHVVWVDFAGGTLAPPDLWAFDIAEGTRSRVATAQAWDLIEPRVVAAHFANLVEHPAGPRASAATTPSSAPSPEVSEVARSEPLPEATNSTAVGAREALPSTAPGGMDPSPPAARSARRLSLIIGMGFSRISGGGDVALYNVASLLAFYGRVSEWLSIGVRLRSAALGYSSLSGTIVACSLGVPSLMTSFRESLGTAAVLEIGVHAEGGFNLHYYENSPRYADGPQVYFGIGVGAFANLELGAANGLQLDYTADVYGVGDGSVTFAGSTTLNYVHRWD